MKIEAPAKINIGLDVLKRRPDGYHEVDMVMQTIALADTVILERTEEEGIFLSTDLPELPTDASNLAYRAAELLFSEYAHTGGVRVHIEKRIPVAAGLAGGSTDCAAVLSGMNELFSLGASTERLRELGKRLGADVPYCLMGGTARASGIGEKLTPLAPMPKCQVLLSKPAISVSTKAVYEGLTLSDRTEHPDIDGLIRSIEIGELSGIAEHMGNLLESVTIGMHPCIREIEQLMEEHGAVRAMMSGSGPTVFALFADGETAEKVRRTMLRRDPTDQVILTEIR